MMDASQIINMLNLAPLPEEGGYYRETFRDAGVIPRSALPSYSGDRRYSTCIYYLVTPEQFSGLHAAKSTEVYHFYLGDPVQMIQIEPSGGLKKMILSPDIAKGHLVQTVVPANVWQGAKLLAGGSWALMGCTVAPGFEFSDFVGGLRKDLIKRFPDHAQLIRDYTHR